MPQAHIDLMPGEEMILASNPHWFYFWKQVAAAVGIFGLLLLLWTVNTDWVDTFIGWVTLAAFIILVVDVIFEFIQWQTTRFAITTERVAYQSGMIRRRGVSIPLNRVNNVNFHQTMIARMLNNGVVVIESAGESGDSVFENIPDPEKVRTLIFAQVEADEQRDSDRDASSLAKALREQDPGLVGAAGGSTGAADQRTPQQRLAALDALKTQGLVNDQEYAAKRQQILDAL